MAKEQTAAELRAWRRFARAARALREAQERADRERLPAGARADGERRGEPPAEPNLARLVSAWPSLSEKTKADILTLVTASKGQP